MAIFLTTLVWLISGPPVVRPGASNHIGLWVVRGEAVAVKQPLIILALSLFSACLWPSFCPLNSHGLAMWPTLLCGPSTSILAIKDFPFLPTSWSIPATSRPRYPQPLAFTSHEGHKSTRYVVSLIPPQILLISDPERLNPKPATGLWFPYCISTSWEITVEWYFFCKKAFKGFTTMSQIPSLLSLFDERCQDLITLNNSAGWEPVEVMEVV